MSDAVKILLVDDQSLYREGLAELFKKWDEFIVVGDAADGAEAIERCAELHPDLVLMDVKMPGMDGIEACGVIRQEQPGTAVVMLSLYGEKDRVLTSINNGASGYLLKNIHARQLHSKLLSVARGGAVLSDEVVPVCFDALRTQRFVPVCGEGSRQLLASLTDHEKELLRLIAGGASNKDIAAALFLGESTVKKQVSLMLTKLGLGNRVQAAVFALRSGLTE
jgi:DNA-binding NarL/FixJ family response regulator